MKNAKINYLEKRKFKIEIGGHEVITDLPEKAGGDDSAPTPSELFIASIGSCASLFAARYLETAKLNPAGLSVNIDWDFSEDTSRIASIAISINVPNAVLGARKKAVIAAAEKCVIHNTLKNYPEIKIDVEGN
jgi:uncharacterized OsmC-like protein